MNIRKRVYGLLALLLGSAGIVAQTSSPFPEVKLHDYYGTMTMAVKATMNGVMLTDDVVIAVYCGDDIRGKGSPHDESNPGVAYLTVYGDASSEKLFFKVFHDGAIAEVDPGNVIFQYNGAVGTPSAPYSLDVPSTTVETTFTAEGWATACLPFNGCVPPGVTLWNATRIENSELKIEQIKATVLPKNMPVLLQCTEGMTTCKWGISVANAEQVTSLRPQTSMLMGATEVTEVTANSILTLGHSNESGEIGFWLFTGSTIPANRAYIADFPSGVRGIKWSTDESTGVKDARSDEERSGVYNLKGEKIDAQHLLPGFYVVNGKKMIVRR